MLLGGALCAWKLTTRSMWIDEGATYAITAQHGDALWRAIAHDGGNMLLYYLAVHVLTSLWGVGLIVLRGPSVLAAGLTAGLVALLALRLFGGSVRVAAAAAALTAVSLPLVFWGQNARGYAWMVTLVVASMLALQALIDGDGRPRVAAGAYAAALALALYVGFDAALAVPAQLMLVYVLRRDRLAPMLAALTAVAAAAIPLLVLAARRGSAQLFWVPPVRASGLWQAWTALSSSALEPGFHSAWATVALAILTAVAACACAAALLRDRDPAALQPAAWLIVTMLIALVLAVAGEPLELDRIAPLLIPALALLLAWGLAGGGVSWPPAGGVAGPRAGLVALLILLGLRVAVLAPAYGVSPEPWNRVTGAVRAQVSPARPACVAFYPQDGRMPFGYYVRRSGGAPGLTPVWPAEPWSVVTPHVEAYAAGDPAMWRTIVARCPRLLLVASHVGQRDGPSVSRAHLRSYDALLRLLRSRYRSARTTRFGWAAAIDVTLLRR